MSKFKVISPVDGSVYKECQLNSKADIENVLASAKSAQRIWEDLPLFERKAYIEKFIKAFESKTDIISEELSWQMGRPISHSPYEVQGAIARTKGMLDLAKKSLSDVLVDEISGRLPHPPVGRARQGR